MKSKSCPRSCGCEAELGSRFLWRGWGKETTPMVYAPMLGHSCNRQTERENGKTVLPFNSPTLSSSLVSMPTGAFLIAVLAISKKNVLVSFPVLHHPNKENTQWRSTHRHPISHLKVQYQNQTQSTGCAYLVGTHDAQGARSNV